jgi:EAL domain-containing protein (putative c-di-GMP-specific phosphodiesterase class I)
MRERERLLLHYQPVYDLASGGISHFEALVRIRDGERLVMPSVILPLVEMRGCECELDHAVLDRLREDLARGAVPAGTAVAFNVSGPGMVDPRLIERILALAAAAPAHPLILEITETSLITRISEATDHLQRLRGTGLRVALDDFGNGYSSLRYLAHMPVDEVKFDRTLVHSLTARDRQAVLVRDLARLIADAGYRLVAEGIESAEMLEAAKAAGFHKAQGFNLGAPAPPP